jgi:uncharacterized protein
MDMQGSRALAIDQQQAWDALNDPEVLKVCIPGCESIEATGENQYAVRTSIKVGPVSAKFGGKIKLADVQAPSSYTLHFDGQGGAAGFGKGSAKVQLLPQASGCGLQYSVTAQVGGKIAQVGQRLIDGVAKSMAEDFFARFDGEMQRRHPAAYAAASDAGSAQAVPQPQTNSAPGAAGIPKWVWVAGVAVLLVMVWLLR